MATKQIINGKGEYVSVPTGYATYNVLDYGAVGDGVTDDAPAIQTLVNSIDCGTVFIPAKTFLLKSSITWKSNISLIGEDRTLSVLKTQGSTGFPAIGPQSESVSSYVIIENCAFENFTIDGSALSTGTYTPSGKGIFFIGVTNCTFKKLNIFNTCATGLGIDGLKNVVIDDVCCDTCGREWTNGQLGGAGIGIGTRVQANESFVITNCLCVNCGAFGIFVEDQLGNDDGVFDSHYLITNNVVRDGRNNGIGVVLSNRVLIENNIVRRNANVGILVGRSYNSSGAAQRYSKDILISANLVCENNYGIKVSSSGFGADGGISYVTISNNVVQDNTDGGIGIESSTKNTSILANVTTGNNVGIRTSQGQTMENFVAVANVSYDNTTFDVSNKANHVGYSGKNEFKDIVTIKYPMS